MKVEPRPESDWSEDGRRRVRCFYLGRQTAWLYSDGLVTVRAPDDKGMTGPVWRPPTPEEKLALAEYLFQEMARGTA